MLCLYRVVNILLVNNRTKKRSIQNSEVTWKYINKVIFYYSNTSKTQATIFINEHRTKFSFPAKGDY